MTLVISLCNKNEFVLVASDSKIIARDYDSESFKKLDDKVHFISEGERRKTRRLTKNVLLVTLGIKMTGDIIEENLKLLVEEDFYLEDCIEKLNLLLTELRTRAISTREVDTLEDIGALSLNFIGTKEFSLQLIGFTRDGRTGIADINREKWQVNYHFSPLDDGMATIGSPSSEDNENYMNWLYIQDLQKRTLPNFIDRVLLTHSKLSLIHEESVSSDCNITCLINTPDGIQLKEFNFDTSKFYSFLKDNPQIDYTTPL